MPSAAQSPAQLIVHACTVTQFMRGRRRKPSGINLHGTPRKITNGLVRAGHDVIVFDDREIARGSTMFNARKMGIKPANEKLIQLIEQVRPDILLLGHADVIRVATISKIRERFPDMKIAQWSVDALFVPDFKQRLVPKLDLVDVTFSSTAGERLEQLGAGGHRVAYLPNPCDAGVERARTFETPRSQLKWDLIFPCGNPNIPRINAGQERLPADIVDFIAQQVPGTRLLTPGVHNDAHLLGAAYQNALASSAMGLNISRDNRDYLYSSDRIAQFAGNGLLTLIDRATGFDDLFADDEFAFYKTEQEMAEQVQRFVSDDDARRKVAQAGWNAYTSMFNTARVGKYMIDVILGEVDPAAFKWRNC